MKKTLLFLTALFLLLLPGCGKIKQAKNIVNSVSDMASAGEESEADSDWGMADLSEKDIRKFYSGVNHLNEKYPEVEFEVAVTAALAAMTEGIETIKAAMADLVEGNLDLGRRISDAASRLDTLAQEVRALKVLKRKPKVKHKPRPVKIPPFHIDAIDVWDDMTYVAVSQAGRTAFLKAGEQQSGWTVSRIDHLKGQVDLKGPVGQVHSVSLQR